MGINDLDSSRQTWKIVVYHQPAFSSGDATILNNQMRAVAKLLEDHGVNMVFNGHEHNYQRTLPIRSTSRTAGPVSTTARTPAVYVDQNFDGTTRTVPDGVLYLVERAGGNATSMAPSLRRAAAVWGLIRMTPRLERSPMSQG